MFEAVKAAAPHAAYHPLSRAIAVKQPRAARTVGRILVMSAGTSDIPVAEEAAVTAEILGSRVETVYDVGVAGLHRVLDQRASLEAARVVVVAAGMDGAGGGPGGGFGGMNFNPANAVIQLRDSLALTEDQVAKLKPIADSVAARNTSLGTEFQKMIRDAGANPDMGAVMGRMQPRLQQLQKENEAVIKSIEAILTPEQWAKVPPRVRTGGRFPGQHQGRLGQ